MAKELSKLFVTLGMDDKAFGKSLDKLQGDLKQVGKMMTGIGVAITGAFTIATKEWADAGDEIQEMSQRTGFATEALSELNYAAELSGASLGELEKASRTLSGVITDAGEGGKAYIESLTSIGLSYEKLKDLSPEEQFMEVLEALARVSDESERAAKAQDLFGKSGAELLPLLADGTSGLNRMRKEARELGIVFDEEASEKAAALKDALTKLQSAFKGIGAVIADTLAPIITKLAGKISDVTINIKDWAKNNPKLSQTLTVVTAGVGVFSSTVGPLLMMLPTLAASMKIVTASMIGQTAVAINAAFAVGGLSAGFTALKIAMLSNPFGWIALAITGVIAGIILLLANWEKVIDFFGGNDASRAFSRWANDVRKNSDQMISDIESAFSEWEVSARDTTSAITDELDKQVDAARDAHDKKMKLLDEEQLAELAKVDKQAAFRLKMLQGQKDAISQEIETQQRAAERADEDARIAEYEARIREEMDAERRLELQQQLAAYIEDVNRGRWEQEQRDIQDSLSKQMDAVRESAETRKQSIEDEYKKKKEAEDAQLKITIENIDTEKALAEQALDEQFARYDKDLAAFKAMNDGKIEDVTAFVNEYNRLMGLMGGDESKIIGQPEIPETNTKRPTVDAEGKVKTSGFDWSWLLPQELLFPSFAGWEGRVPGPEGMAYPAVVHGGEYISQKPGGESIVNNFNISELVVREDADVRRIARELFTMQQSRQRAGA